MSHAPVHIVRFGLIKVSIWRNTTKAGDRHSVSVVRLYRNGDQWKESNRFGRDDLPLVAKAIDNAHSWIFENGNLETSSAESSWQFASLVSHLPSLQRQSVCRRAPRDLPALRTRCSVYGARSVSVVARGAGAS